MSSRASDREDLLREATALAERAELGVADWPEPLVAGFRANGAASFFFGADHVFQFNTAGELRRAYVGGAMLKAEQGQLVELVRQRGAAGTSLLRRELSTTESAALTGDVERRLSLLGQALVSGRYELVRQIPSDVDVVTRIARWIDAPVRPVAIARLPGVR